MVESGSPKSTADGARQCLAVCASQTGLCQTTEVGGGWDWDVLPFQTVEEILHEAEAERLDAVALPFDPLDQDSRQTFLRLAQSQKEGRPFLVSYSAFNPAWIENLVAGAGSNLHVRGSLHIRDLIERLDQLAS